MARQLEKDVFLRLAEPVAGDVRTTAVPVFRRMSADLLTPVAAFLRLRAAYPNAFLFESVEGGEKLARYSFLGAAPRRVLRPGMEDDVFAALRASVADVREVKAPGLPRFTGGAVGFVGYDAVRRIEYLPDGPPDELGLPTAVWGLYDQVVAFDHVKHQLVLMSTAHLETGANPEAAWSDAQDRLDELASVLGGESPPGPDPIRLPEAPMSSSFERADFLAAVDRARRYIRDGDIFQVVLSQRFESGFEGDPFNLYRALRQVNPSPYLFYLDLDDLIIAGSSPELLVRVEGDHVETLPIAGTRPRGRDEAEDRALEQELVADVKERAEHVMLVDLGRNDLGRVCEIGSVSVDRYAEVARYSHVMHLVSSVSGRLRADADAVDALKACFPAGTVSGAPKVRAMEIIDELEPTARGVYAGAVGYLDYAGNLDTCIAIRTMVVRGGRIMVQAGAGIVADSDPQREFDETTNKAAAMRRAMSVAAGGLL